MYSLDLHVVAEERRKDLERAARQEQIAAAIQTAREHRNESLRALFYKLGAVLVALGARLQIRNYTTPNVTGTVALAITERNNSLSSKC